MPWLLQTALGLPCTGPSRIILRSFLCVSILWQVYTREETLDTYIFTNLSQGEIRFCFCIAVIQNLVQNTTQGRKVFFLSCNPQLSSIIERITFGGELRQGNKGKPWQNTVYCLVLRLAFCYIVSCVLLKYSTTNTGLALLKKMCNIFRYQGNATSVTFRLQPKTIIVIILGIYQKGHKE